MQDATLSGNWAGGGGITNAFNVFSALTMGSSGFGHAPTVAAASDPGSPLAAATVPGLASHAQTTMPLTTVGSASEPAAGHFSQFGPVQVLGLATSSTPASQMSAPAAVAAITPVSTGSLVQQPAWSAAPHGISTPIAHQQAARSSFGVPGTSDAIIRPRPATGLVSDLVLDDLAGDPALWRRQNYDGTITITVLPPDAVSADPSAQPDLHRSSASFAERIAAFGLVAGFWGGAGLVNARKRRLGRLSLDGKPIKPRPVRD